MNVYDYSKWIWCCSWVIIVNEWTVGREEIGWEMGEDGVRGQPGKERTDDHGGKCRQCWLNMANIAGNFRFLLLMKRVKAILLGYPRSVGRWWDEMRKYQIFSLTVDENIKYLWIPPLENDEIVDILVKCRWDFCEISMVSMKYWILDYVVAYGRHFDSIVCIS